MLPPRSSVFISVVFAAVCLLSTPVFAGIPLSGYFCASCDANPHPTDLVGKIHPAYSTVIFAFVGWDTTGNVTNGWDCNSPTCPKNFTLTASAIRRLKNEGRTVLMSVGGAAGAVLDGSESPSFIQTMSTGLVNIVKTFELDGIDFDIENRAGDVVGCSRVVQAVIQNLKTAFPNIILTLTPQMTDLYPDITDTSLAFNAQAPLVSMTINSLAAVQIQMYNTWAQVETVAFAESYAPRLMAGYHVQGDGQDYFVQISNKKLILGYPATPSGAGSGYLAPSDVVGIAQYFIGRGTPLLGLMTWSIGWDELSGWPLASAVAQSGL